MALTKEQKEQIEVEMGDFTHAELAAKYKCSRSTIARVCAAAKAQDAQRSSEAAAATTTTTNNNENNNNNGEPQDKFTYTPETEERQTIELENDEGLGRLLSSHAQLDPIADIEEEEKGDDDAEEGATSSPPDEQDKVLGELIDEAEAAAAAAPTMGGPSEAEVDSMLKGLLGSEDLDDDDEPSLPPPRLTSRKTKTKASSSPSSFSTTGIIRSTTKAAPTSFSAVSAPGGGGGKFAHLPASVLVTQCKLYLTHFEEALECITGKTAQEKDRFIKAIKVNMPREELLGVLSSIRGTITLSTSCSTIRNSLMCGAGLAESVAPMVGMNLTNVTKHLDDRRDEIQLACTQMVLDDFDWWEQKQSGKSQLFFICANTIFTCDAANRSHAAQQQAAAMAAQPISPAVQNKYNTL